jgi:hypothetical protein
VATKAPTFYQEVSAAISHFQAFGFTSQAQLDQWVGRIRRAALLQLKPPAETERELKRVLGDRYKHLVTKAGILNSMPEVSRYTLEKVKPKLRKELDRRIMASANLISLNRQEAVSTTLRRFQGWATAIPPGGSRAPEAKADKDLIRKSLAKMPFEERRVIIDQTHKLVAAIRDITATDAGAIAGMWHSPWRRPGYDYREDHKERDEKIYAIRGNWAIEKGLMKAGPNGYLDAIDGPGFLPFCSCQVQYLFSLSRLPPEFLTKAGMYALPVKSTAKAA